MSAARSGPALRLPPCADGGHADERADHRALGPDQRGALLRAAGSAVRGPGGAGLPARLQLQRRILPLLRRRARCSCQGAEARHAQVERGDGQLPRALGFTFVPTFTIYDANRDLMRARQADWHKRLYLEVHVGLLPRRSGAAMASYWYALVDAERESSGKQNYRLWMAFINEYKNRGGRVCTGSRLRLHLPDLRLRLCPRARVIAGGRVPPARGAARGDHVRGRGAVRDRAGRDRHGRGRQARGPAGARPQPAEGLQAAVRHRRHAAERGDQRRRVAARPAPDDQGRHRLRHGRAAGRRARHGGRELAGDEAGRPSRPLAAE